MKLLSNQLFLDIEYGNTKQDPTEISLASIDDQYRILIEFHSFIKFNHASVKSAADRKTYSISKIPFLLLEKGLPLEDLNTKLESILLEKEIFHWAGNEKNIIKNHMRLKVQCSFQDLSNTWKNNDTKIKMVELFQAINSDCKNLEVDLHSAKIDSYVLAIVYKYYKLKTNPSAYELEQLCNYIGEKRKLIEAYKKEEQKARNSIKGSGEGKFHARKIHVYFSGFSNVKKIELKDMCRDVGINVTASKNVQINDYVIFDDIKKISQYPELKSKAITLSQFMDFINNDGELKSA